VDHSIHAIGRCYTSEVDYEVVFLRFDAVLLHLLYELKSCKFSHIESSNDVDSQHILKIVGVTFRIKDGHAWLSDTSTVDDNADVSKLSRTIFNCFFHSLLIRDI